MHKTLSLIVVVGGLIALGACSSTTEEKAGAGAVAGAVVGGAVGHHMAKTKEKKEAARATAAR